MIFIPVIGNRGEGAASSLLNIVNGLLTQQDTNKVLILDYQGMISEDFCWDDTVCVEKIYMDNGNYHSGVQYDKDAAMLEALLVNPDILSAKLCIIRPNGTNMGLYTSDELPRFIEGVMEKIETNRINCNRKNYCLLTRSI